MTNITDNRAIITFHNPKTDQKIVINMTIEENGAQLDPKFDPPIEADQNLGLIGFLCQKFMECLTDGTDNTTESDSRK